ncbi:uncharacterized protein LOC128736043 [Sabethes cyaneus]|uniref:uncharacterized protein LOC128736043 n=1 Tax=Sabethes cyaneus TaxID=53552 RepID=UPI00237ED862|nr:uncharacterized protein LOC128736043 [Sabethes cyaneus]
MVESSAPAAAKSADLNETRLFGEVPVGDVCQNSTPIGGSVHEVSQEISKLSLRSSSPEDDNDKSSGFGSIMSSIVNIDSEQASGKNDNSNGDFFVPPRKAADFASEVNESEQHQNTNYQPVVIDIENGADGEIVDPAAKQAQQKGKTPSEVYLQKLLIGLLNSFLLVSSNSSRL